MKRNQDLDEKTDELWELVKPISQCRCNDFGYEALIPQDLDGSVKHEHHENNGSCSFQLQSYSTDIEMSAVVHEMPLDYPSYVWTHNGWVQQLDTTYDAEQWKNEPLEVYVVPFSHSDPGWIYTYESYYSSWTKVTLDTVVNQLTRDPTMTFVWAEVIFLERWYREAEKTTKAAFRRLLESERFEIVSGGWVMTDEAITHYAAVLDQLMEGQLWLLKELGYRVRSAWSLDAFGHSSTVAYLLRLSGIEAMSIQRSHYAVKKHLAFRQELEFTWQQDWDHHQESSIFCHLAPYLLYSIQYSCGPDINVCCQFDFSRKKCWKWGDYQPAQPITNENVEKKAYELLDQLRKKATFFRHNLLLFPFGDDFRFVSENEWNEQFGNLTKLFWYMNSHPEMRVQVRFSTLGKYLEAVKQKAAKPGGWSVPTLKGDFFPYSDRSDQYWSGYFSSRPILKCLARILQSRLRTVELLFSLALTSNQVQGVEDSSVAFFMSLYKTLESLRREHALLQHHDTITGTSRLSVVSDTLESVRRSLKSGGHLVGQLIANLLKFTSPQHELTMLEDQISGKSVPSQQLLNLETANERLVIIFNPLANHVTQIIRFLVSSFDVQVYDVKGNSVACQVSPVLDRSNIFLEGVFDLYFEVKIAALSLVSYVIRKTAIKDDIRCSLSKVVMINFQVHQHISSPFLIDWYGIPGMSVSNRYLTVTLCRCTHLMQNIITRNDMIPYKTEMKFAFYRTGNWVNPYKDKSGAYIFLPDGPSKDMGCRNCRAIVIEGPLLSSATTWLNITSQIIKLYNTEGIQGSGVHITNHVDLRSHDNVEIVMKIKTRVKNSGHFYTDLNGFQLYRRTTLNRLPIQGNFYPMTNAAVIQDDHVRFSLLSTQSHAVASLEPGSLELILDRRLAQDDWRGLKEGVQDNIPNYSSFLLTVERWKKPIKTPGLPSLTVHLSRQVQQLSISLDNPPVIMSMAPGTNYTYSLLPFSPFASHLPCDLHIVNLRSLNVEKSTCEMLLVLHRFGVECNLVPPLTSVPECNNSNKILLSSLFQHVTFKSVDEMSLTGTFVTRTLTPTTPVSVKPMEIKTWKLTL